MCQVDVSKYIFGVSNGSHRFWSSNRNSRLPGLVQGHKAVTDHCKCLWVTGWQDHLGYISQLSSRRNKGESPHHGLFPLQLSMAPQGVDFATLLEAHTSWSHSLREDVRSLWGRDAVRSCLPDLVGIYTQLMTIVWLDARWHRDWELRTEVFYMLGQPRTPGCCKCSMQQTSFVSKDLYSSHSGSRQGIVPD